MLIGGDIGSTAGGIKIFRLLVILMLIRLIFARTCLPRHAVLEPRVAGHTVEPAEMNLTVGLVLLYLAVVAVSWFAFVISGFDGLDSLFEVVSAVGTVGLSAGLAASDLPSWLKLVLCVDMLVGRLEIIGIFVLVYPRTWFGRRASGI